MYILYHMGQDVKSPSVQDVFLPIPGFIILVLLLCVYGGIMPIHMYMYIFSFTGIIFLWYMYMNVCRFYLFHI